MTVADEVAVTASSGDGAETPPPSSGVVTVFGRSYQAADLGWLVVWIATIAFAVVFWRLARGMHERFLTNSFDLGIFSQGLWLLSRFHAPFVTLRGLDLFADHSSYIMLPMVPLYWVWADVRMLILFTVLILAAGGPLVYVTGRRLGVSPLLSAAAAVAYLLHPALWWAVWDTFHPEFVAIPLLIATFSLLLTKRTGWATVTFIGVLLVKEDAALVAVPLALFLGWYLRTWRWAARAAVLGIGAFVLNLFVLLPALSPTGEPFRVSQYALEGVPITGGILSLIWATVSHPVQLIRTLWSPTRGRYLLEMLLPVPLWFGAPDLVAVAIPITVANMLATQTYQHQIQYHYTAYLLAILAISSLVALQRLRPALTRIRSVVLAAMIVSAGLLGGLVVGPDLTDGSFGVKGPHQDAIHAAIAMIPDGASVSAESHIATHLANREVVYTWHNPFGSPYWGVGDPPHSPQELIDLDYVILQPSAIPAGSEAAEVLEGLLSSPEWRPLVDTDAVILLEHVR